MNPSPLILLAGESNHGFQNSGLAPYIPTWRVQIWTDTDADGLGDAFNYMNPGVNVGLPNDPTTWSHAVSLANNWLAANPEGSSILWLGQVAKGGTTLAVDWAPDTGFWYECAELTANSMLANLGRESLDAVFWTQGINDAMTLTHAQAYESNLSAFLPKVRAEWMHDAEGYIGLARIQDSPSVPYNFDVRLAQWNVDQADPFLESFKTIGFDFQADTIHLSSLGYDQLGDAYWNNWIA